MQRITITIEDDLLAEIDAAAKARGYQNRSEIVRDDSSGVRRASSSTAGRARATSSAVGSAVIRRSSVDASAPWAEPDSIGRVLMWWATWVAADRVWRTSTALRRRGNRWIQA